MLAVGGLCVGADERGRARNKRKGFLPLFWAEKR